MLISVLIPVYNTESTLLDCLNSVLSQDCDLLNNKSQIEIIVLNDASTGRDLQGNSCKKIIKLFQKSIKKNHKYLDVLYFEHSKNLGLLHTRRDMLYEAHGEYTLSLDSDDTLTPNALNSFLNAIKLTHADIIHGKTNLITDSPDKEEKIKKNAENVFIGQLNNTEILDGLLLKNNHNGYVCTKLIKREVYLNAFEFIPNTYCVMADDYLQYLWICTQAKSYYGIDKYVYNYNHTGGITSQKEINDLGTWKKICSTASVFTSIFSTLETLDYAPFTSEQLDIIRLTCRMYLKNNLLQLNTVVSPALHDQAYQMLCDWWGPDFVSKMEKEL